MAKQPLCDVICESLKREILDGTLKPGQRLMEVHYAKKFGVSRTPFREAVRRLEIEGFVTVLPRCGAQVSTVSKKDIEDVLDIRTALDMLAVKLFIQNMQKKDLKKLKSVLENFDNAIETGNKKQKIMFDVEFHEIIYSKSGNERLWHMYSGLKDQLYRYRVLYLDDIVHTDIVSKEHYQIYNAIESADAELAAQLVGNHILSQKKGLEKL